MQLQEMTTTLVEATRALGIVGFLGCELEWNVPEQTPKGLNITTSSPQSFTLPLQTHVFAPFTTRLYIRVADIHCLFFLTVLHLFTYQA